jgi:alkylated DNA nucleotide flippase Atl1
MVNKRSIEKDVGCTLILSKDQDFESEWRVMQCKGSAEQVKKTKQKIDKLLREAGKAMGDESAFALECHIVGSVPIKNGKFK